MKEDSFDIQKTLRAVRRFLPAQAPLKDFISINTLQAFQNEPFHQGLIHAQKVLGSRGYLSLSEYAEKLRSGKIDQEVLRWVAERKGSDSQSLLDFSSVSPKSSSPARLRDLWKSKYRLDLITHVHPILFRHIGHFIDQGISFSPVPGQELGFWKSLQELEKNSYFSIFRGGKESNAHHLLALDPWEALTQALSKLVGDDSWFEKYLFEMTQEHPGWSGLLSVIEEHPEHLNFERSLSFHEAVAFELLLELDYIDFALKKNHWTPLALLLTGREQFETEIDSRSALLFEVLQEAMEWSYYRPLLTALTQKPQGSPVVQNGPQIFFCIDDRCSSLRRHLEEVCPEVKTFGVPGFFSVDILFQGETERFPVKLCPAPLTPQTLIRGTKHRKKRVSSDFLLSRLTHTLFGGWLVSNTFGVFSAFRMLANIFSPTLSLKMASSFAHVEAYSEFNLLRKGEHKWRGLFLGFSQEEMADRVFSLLKSSGLSKNLSDLVVLLGHGSSTVNNPHYAAYDCGACSGRPGAINARLFCQMANQKEVRDLVRLKGIEIPTTTWFVPGLFDTTRDEVAFFDEGALPEHLSKKLANLKASFEEALKRNSKERSRRFEEIPLDISLDKSRKRLQQKSVSIFDPRQEFTHAGNASCIIGPRDKTRGIFLDRRAFLNSYDPSSDPSGEILTHVLKAAVPVCGGINLQYFFSRTDNEKLGSGTKLPHNVVGLLSVANGTEGDLRSGLPMQMVEWHDPVRLLIVVFQEPEIALPAAQKIPATFEWIQNEWVRFSCISPTTNRVYIFESGEMKPFQFLGESPKTVGSSLELLGQSRDYLPPVFIREGESK